MINGKLTNYKGIPLGKVWIQKFESKLSQEEYPYRSICDCAQTGWMQSIWNPKVFACYSEDFCEASTVGFLGQICRHLVIIFILDSRTCGMLSVEERACHKFPKINKNKELYVDIFIAFERRHACDMSCRRSNDSMVWHFEHCAMIVFEGRP